MRDHLRRPVTDDPTRDRYKEWLHVNVFDHASGAIGLVNVSVHGDPRVQASRGVGAALVHLPGTGWAGNAEVVAAPAVPVGVLSMSTPAVAVAVDPVGHVAAVGRLPADRLDLSLQGVAVGAELGAVSVMEFGSGHLGWYVYPRLRVDGHLVVGTLDVPLSGAGGYADHNWGRWWWGDDAGWDWACWHGADGLLVVLSRMTNRAHTRTGLVLLTVEVAGRVVRFVGDQILVEAHGVATPSRRFPGALAALFADHAAERLPARIVVHAANGFDGLDLEFDVRDVAQLVMAEPAQPGFAFLHELVGAFRCTGLVAGCPVDSTGLGVLERAG
ncbi:hypothetical protein ACPPVS_10410 [Cellulomonas sp. McL0617]|uniref:hypothetical protein n=1 Tax=Cellulomonas sp. McL0617 TaxID=3415675 RepID=UPI003CE9476F